MSQEQLAALTRGKPGQVSRAMISAVERGRHLPGLEVMVTLAQALHLSPAEVWERVELARLPRHATDGLELDELDRRGNRRFWAGDHRGAVAYYDAVLRRLEGDTSVSAPARDRRIAVTETRRAAALRRCGTTAAARAAIERAIALSDGIPEVQAEAYVVLVALLVQQGCLPLARDVAERGVQLAAAHGEPRVQGWAWIEKGVVLFASRSFEEALAAFVEARKCVRAAGDRNHRIHVEGNIGACLLELGRYEQARRRFRRAVELSRRFEVPNSEGIWLVELGRLALRLDEIETADSYAQAALRIAKPAGHRVTCFRAEWLRHRIQQRRTPDDPDRHRVAYLRRLYSRLDDQRGIEEIREFRRIYCTAEEGDAS